MVDTPTSARAKLAGSFVGGPPDPETEERLRCNLATSNLDREIRAALGGGRRMSDSEVGHLVGLLLAESLVDGDTVTRCEAYVRDAVRTCRAKQSGAA